MTGWYVSNQDNSVSDSDDDMTTAALPERPCANGCDAPMAYPHSICRICVEAKRWGSGDVPRV